MRRLALLSAAVVVTLATLAAACGGGSAGAAGNVRFLVFGDPEEIKAYRDVIAAFEREEPELDVQLVEAADRKDLLTRLSTSVAGGSPPDVFLINYRFYGQFASKGVLEPLQDRVEESDVFEPDDFYAVALDAFRWNGVLTCLPQNVSSLVVYYNVDLFRKNGVPPPRVGWTWNEMLLAAQRLTLDAAGRPLRAGDPDAGGATADIYGLGVEPTLIRIAPFVWSNGGKLLDDEQRPTRLTLDRRESLAALKAFLDLRIAYGVVPSDVEVEAEDDESRFQNGRLAMLLSSRRSTPTFRAITDFEWDVAPLPVHVRPAGILHSDAYCMTTASDAKDTAWRFIEFANSPEGQRIVARTGRTVPSLIDVSRSPAFLDPDAAPKSSETSSTGSRRSGGCRRSRPGPRSRTRPRASWRTVSTRARRSRTWRASSTGRRGRSSPGPSAKGSAPPLAGTTAPMDDEERDELKDEDLEEQDGELLPEREEMSVLDLGEGGGLAPPAP